MRERQFVSFFMFTLSVIVIFPNSEIRACSCIAPPPPSDAFENSDAVFLADVTSFERAGEHRRVAKFRLLKRWKGDKVGEIFTSPNSGLCGFNFITGKTYVIYGFKNQNGELLTNICTRTVSVEQAGEDLTFLEEKDPFFTRDDSGCCGSVSGGDALLAGSVILFLFVRRR